jgi:hypothetical protein
MKMLIFVVIMTLVAAVVFWRVRKADAERDLARRNELKQKRAQLKQAITPEDPVTWPTIIKTVGKRPADGDEQLPEPSMSTIEFKPVERPSLNH